VQGDAHLLAVLRYVERNPLAAGLVARAEDWRWGDLWARAQGDQAIRAILSAWPVECPADWIERVNTPLSAKELGRLRVSLERGRPYGAEEWVERTASELNLGHTLRPEGRPPMRSSTSPQ
jgi:putative transposase